MQNEESDKLLLEQARQRAGRLLDGVTSDLESLRAVGSDAAYADGAALCDEVADAARQLLAHLDAEIGRHLPNPATEGPQS